MLTDRNREVILALAECSMNQAEVSRVKYLHINTVAYQIQKIRENTGLDPQNFYDLTKLVEMARDGGAPEAEAALKADTGGGRTMFVTIDGVHFNMDYFSAFSWEGGEVRITNDAGRVFRISDPDKSLYRQMCEKAEVLPEK